MKTRSLVGITLANPIRPTILIILLLLAGRPFNTNAQTETNVILGPMPSLAHLPDPLARRTAGEIRNWIQNFRPRDALALNATGKIVFSWDELRASYPEQARVVDDYMEQIRTNLVETVRRDTHPIPDRLAMHHTPDTVEVEGLGSGAYRIVITSREGMAHSFLEFSARR